MESKLCVCLETTTGKRKKKKYAVYLGEPTLMHCTTPVTAPMGYKLVCFYREKVHAFHVFVCEQHVSLGLSSAVVCPAASVRAAALLWHVY